MPKADIYHFERRLELAEGAILAARISKIVLLSILQFRDQCFADGLGLPRVVKYMVTLKRLYDLAPWAVQRVR